MCISVETPKQKEKEKEASNQSVSKLLFNLEKRSHSLRLLHTLIDVICDVLNEFDCRSKVVVVRVLRVSSFEQRIQQKDVSWDSSDGDEEVDVNQRFPK
jgi:hypothetical protein